MANFLQSFAGGFGSGLQRGMAMQMQQRQMQAQQDAAAGKALIDGLKTVLDADPALRGPLAKMVLPKMGFPKEDVGNLASVFSKLSEDQSAALADSLAGSGFTASQIKTLASNPVSLMGQLSGVFRKTNEAQARNQAVDMARGNVPLGIDQARMRPGVQRQEGVLEVPLGTIQQEAPGSPERRQAAEDILLRSGQREQAGFMRGPEREQHARFLIDAGVPGGMANRIAGGLIKVSRDDFGRVKIVDISNGKEIKTSQKMAENIHGAVSAPGAPTLPATIDPAEGTGVSGFAAKVFNTITDAMGLGLAAPEAEKASSVLKVLQRRTQMGLSSNFEGRNTNMMMKMMEELTVTPSSVLQGDARAQEKMSELRALLVDEASRIRKDILGDPQSHSPTTLSKARAEISKLDGLAREYDAVISAMGGRPPEGLPSGAKKVGTLNGKDVWQGPDGKKYVVE